MTAMTIFFNKKASRVSSRTGYLQSKQNCLLTCAIAASLRTIESSVIDGLKSFNMGMNLYPRKRRDRLKEKGLFYVFYSVL